MTYFNRFFLAFFAASVLLPLLAPSRAFAEVSVRAEVSPPSGSSDELFTFSVVVEGARAAAAPRLSDTKDFDVRYVGPNQFVSIINGAVSARTSHIFQMTPRREGDLLTPSAELSVGGQSFRTAPLKVHVSKEDAGQDGQGKPGAEEIIFRQSISPTTAIYEGEQLANIIDLYFAVGIAEIAPFDLTADGFWQESLSDGDRAQRIVNGRQYETLQIVKALYPLASGKLVIPSRLFRAKAARPVRQRANDPFNAFDPFANDLFDSFLQRVEYQNVSRRSNQVIVDVKPLPPAPADIQPLLGPATIVGPTSLAVDSDVSIARVGDSKTVTYVVTSEGNINPLTELSISAPEGLKVYPERPETKRERRGDKLILKRYFPFSVVPLKPGLVKIPPARLAYFSPESGSYQVASSKEVAFAVQGQALVGDNGEPASAAGSQRTALPTLPPLPFAPDLAYEEPNALERALEVVSLKTALLVASALLGLWLLISLASRLRPAPDSEGLSAGDLAKVSSLPALEQFLRALAAARLPALRSDAPLDELRARVALHVKDQDLALAVRSLFDELEVLRYGAPSGKAADEALGRLKLQAQGVLSRWR